MQFLSNLINAYTDKQIQQKRHLEAVFIEYWNFERKKSIRSCSAFTSAKEGLFFQVYFSSFQFYST